LATTIGEAELQALAADALAGLGLTREDAADCARILVLGDLFGVHTHGVARIESYGERLDLGGIKARPGIRIDRVAPTIAKVDGDNGVGPLVGYRALEAAMAMAREAGTGIAFARGSNHFGAVGPYNLLAAEQGFASIIGSNSTTTIAPTGGREARLGNSPLGFGLPNPGGRPIILDMAISVVARAKIRNALKSGQPIPDTWATDKDGNPTTDPKAALDGFLQPIGGYKGYGLALIVDLFAGLLSGAAYLTHVQSWSDAPEKAQDLGHFFFLIDTRKLGPSSFLAERMNDFASILHSTPATDPARDGIVLDPAVLASLERFARRTPG
jgi:ureidoglycolate dehydrogenase (NAD+)